MSRIGKKPVPIAKGVTVTVDGSQVAVKGPKGTLERRFPTEIGFEVGDDRISVTRVSDDKRVRALHGLSRSLLQNMVTGVSEGFSKQLELHGVGYRAEVTAGGVRLSLGYSHPVDFVAPDGITIAVEGTTQVTVSGIDKELVGEVAAEIRMMRPPEPYKGKGVRYVGEQVRRKAGKTGAKA